jgi:hypothetical protein
MNNSSSMRNQQFYTAAERNASDALAVELTPFFAPVTCNSRRQRPGYHDKGFDLERVAPLVRNVDFRVATLVASARSSHPLKQVASFQKQSRTRPVLLVRLFGKRVSALSGTYHVRYQ